MQYGVLIHDKVDDVGVAVMNLAAGSEIGVATLEGEAAGVLTAAQDIPLGHKIALHAMNANHHVIEYGRAIGYATQAIAQGAHVHVHNLRGLRWGGKSQIIER
jgi:(2R)-sulfolactate sulfo-lyase subunit alpha